jgi:hypothetical protein
MAHKQLLKQLNNPDTEKWRPNGWQRNLHDIIISVSTFLSNRIYKLAVSVLIPVSVYCIHHRWPTDSTTTTRHARTNDMPRHSATIPSSPKSSAGQLFKCPLEEQLFNRAADGEENGSFQAPVKLPVRNTNESHHTKFWVRSIGTVARVATWPGSIHLE